MRVFRTTWSTAIWRGLRRFGTSLGTRGEPILVMATNQQQDWVNQAQAMKEDLESLGAEVDLQVYDTGALLW